MGQVYQATDTKLKRQLRSNVGQRTNGEYGEGYVRVPFGPDDEVIPAGLCPRSG